MSFFQGAHTNTGWHYGYTAKLPLRYFLAESLAKVSNNLLSGVLSRTIHKSLKYIVWKLVS